MKNLKPILVLVLVFVAGAVVGSVATRRVAIGMVRRAVQNPEFMRERAHKEMVHRIGLSPAQAKQVDAIFADTQRQLWELRRKNQPEFFGIISNSQYRISAELTPEQREKFQRFRAENRRFLVP